MTRASLPHPLWQEATVCQPERVRGLHIVSCTKVRTKPGSGPVHQWYAVVETMAGYSVYHVTFVNGRYVDRQAGNRNQGLEYEDAVLRATGFALSPK